MQFSKPDDKCPYADDCSGYVGSYTCINNHHVHCKRFQLLREADECYDNMKDILRGLKNE